MADLATLIDRLTEACGVVTAEMAETIADAHGPWEVGSEEHKLFCLACSGEMEAVGAALMLVQRVLGDRGAELAFEQERAEDGRVMTHAIVNVDGRTTCALSPSAGGALVIAMLGAMLETEESEDDEIDSEEVAALANLFMKGAAGNTIGVAINAAAALITTVILESDLDFDDAMDWATTTSDAIVKTVRDDWEPAPAASEEETRDIAADADDAPPKGRLH